jgi:hypothetical protein
MSRVTDIDLGTRNAVIVGQQDSVAFAASFADVKIDSAHFCLASERQAPVSDSISCAGGLANSVPEGYCLHQLRAGPALQGIFGTMCRL